MPDGREDAPGMTDSSPKKAAELVPDGRKWSAAGADKWENSVSCCSGPC